MINHAASDDPNAPLAKSCQDACAACCCKGKIFLPEKESDGILRWLQANSPNDVSEFCSRIERMDGFCLYDQKQRCQFLDSANLCRLHVPGVKPRECFWWPLHVFDAGNGELEIRASTSCCRAWQYAEKDSRLAKAIVSEVELIGRDVVTRFRQAYGGNCEGSLLRF